MSKCLQRKVSWLSCGNVDKGKRRPHLIFQEMSQFRIFIKNVVNFLSFRSL